MLREDSTIRICRRIWQFLDWGGNGYAIVHATQDWIETEFVCIPRPTEKATTEDGGPTVYRVAFRVKPWKICDVPVMERTLRSGEVTLNI